MWLFTIQYHLIQIIFRWDWYQIPPSLTNMTWMACMSGIKIWWSNWILYCICAIANCHEKSDVSMMLPHQIKTNLPVKSDHRNRRHTFWKVFRVFEQRISRVAEKMKKCLKKWKNAKNIKMLAFAQNFNNVSWRLIKEQAKFKVDNKCEYNSIAPLAPKKRNNFWIMTGSSYDILFGWSMKRTMLTFNLLNIKLNHIHSYLG